MAELAAEKGADVTGIDLAPALIETAKERAREQGLDIDYRVGDCENLDVRRTAPSTSSRRPAASCSRPTTRPPARELARVVKPGGRIGLANWTPAERGLAALFRIMKPFQPPPPEGTGFPVRVGRARSMCTSCSASRSTSSSSGMSSHLARTDAARTYWRALLVELRAHEDARRVAGRRPARGAAPRLGRLLRARTTESDGEIEHDREWLFVYGTRR